jgi:hypothetical protein
MDGGHADIVDELLFHEKPRVPDGVEHLSDGKRGGGVLADQPETLLQFGRDRILQPEEARKFEILAEPGSFDGVRRWWVSCSSSTSQPCASRTAWKSCGT